MLSRIFAHNTNRVEAHPVVKQETTGAYESAITIVDVAGNETTIHLFAETPEGLEIKEAKQ